MKKKTAGSLLGLLALLALLCGCSENKATQAAKESIETEKEGTGESIEQEQQEDKGKAEEASQEEPAAPAPKVGVVLPENSTSTRWSLDSFELQKALTKEGYEVVLRWSEKEAALQESQIEELISEEVSALIIAPVDPYSLADVLEGAKEKSIPVFSYDGLIMDTDAVKYYAAFDTRKIGQLIGNTIAEKKELKKLQEEKGSLDIEFMMGPLDDNAALFIYNGIMEVLGTYLEDGTLVCRSGKTSFEDTAVPDWSQETAGDRMNDILEEFYPGETCPDIICTAYDGIADGVMEALTQAGGIPGSESWPLISGVGSKQEGIIAVAESTLGFTVFLDNRTLAQECVKMVDTCLSGEEPEVKDYGQYDNGKKIIGTYTCDPQMIDGDNYRIVIDNEYYREEEILPFISPTVQPPEISASPVPQPSGPSVSPASQPPAVSVTPVPEADPFDQEEESDIPDLLYGQDGEEVKFCSITKMPSHPMTGEEAFGKMRLAVKA